MCSFSYFSVSKIDMLIVEYSKWMDAVRSGKCCNLTVLFQCLWLLGGLWCPHVAAVTTWPGQHGGREMSGQNTSHFQGGVLKELHQAGDNSIQRKQEVFWVSLQNRAKRCVLGTKHGSDNVDDSTKYIIVWLCEFRSNTREFYQGKNIYISPFLMLFWNLLVGQDRAKFSLSLSDDQWCRYFICHAAACFQQHWPKYLWFCLVLPAL